MNCPRCERVELEILTAAQRSRAARWGGVALMAGAVVLIVYAAGMVKSILDPRHDPMGLYIWERPFALILFTAAGVMLVGCWNLLFKKSKARGARRCPHCGFVLEAGPNGTLMPMS